MYIAAWNQPTFSPPSHQNTILDCTARFRVLLTLSDSQHPSSLLLDRPSPTGPWPRNRRLSVRSSGTRRHAARVQPCHGSSEGPLALSTSESVTIHLDSAISRLSACVCAVCVRPTCLLQCPRSKRVRRPGAWTPGRACLRSGLLSSLNRGAFVYGWWGAPRVAHITMLRVGILMMAENLKSTLPWQVALTELFLL
ncbi:hypothetical protein BD289DRAFT_202621 [Coniella lustricola]|uniref:Uncharacterized protein n=1 Tax=Coniella lustricola TaxID=2025994 RepID=A0A2T2ZSG2_9PEZI|nr:hypothetical protein BD289DRAFT_202621 [Coniella lustricola]